MSLESQNLGWSSFALASYGGQPSPVSSGTYPQFKVFAVFWPASRSLKGEGWGDRGDLNPRPLVPQTSALTN